MSFYKAELHIENNQEINIDFNGSSSVFSNFLGDLFFYSNNIEIRDNQDQQILGGFFEGNSTPHRNLPQSFVCLPFEEQQLVQYVQSDYSDDSPRFGQFLSSSFIEIASPINIYDTIEGLLGDSLTTGDLTACKHANGRDWWILATVANKPVIYSALFNPEGLESVDTNIVDYLQYTGLGQSVFSPDGHKYVRVNLVGGESEDDYLDVFDFDRATGQLSNHIQENLGANASSGGAAVSPSSQYLYVSHYNYLYQYDLWADDILSTKDTVAIYDGYLEWNLFHSRFYLAQLAPDGKIYVNSPSGVKKLTVIEYPDRPGLACDVRQHSIQLPITMPPPSPTTPTTASAP